MRTVFCPNPACLCGLVWSGSGRTTSNERPRFRTTPEQLDRWHRQEEE